MSTRVWIIRPHGDAWCVPGQSKQLYPSAKDRQKNPQKGDEIVSRKVEGDDGLQETNVKVIEVILWSTTCAGMLLPTFTQKCMHTIAHTYTCLHMRTHTYSTDKKKLKRTKMSSFVPKTYLHPALCQISDFVYFMFWDFLHQFKVNRTQEVEDRGLQKLVYTSSVMRLVPLHTLQKANHLFFWIIW